MSEIYAHKKDYGSVLETLKEHSNRTLKYLSDDRIIISNNLLIHYINQNMNSKFLVGDDNLDFEYIKYMNSLLLKEFIYNHDFGKSNTYFQEYLLNNRQYEQKSLKSHSLKSAIYLFNKCSSKEFMLENNILKYKNLYALLLINYFTVVYRHHSVLNDFDIEDLSSILIEFENNELDSLKTIDNLQNFNFNSKKILTIYKKLVLNKSFDSNYFNFLRYNRGILSFCDHTATAEFFTGTSFVDSRFNNQSIENIKNYYHDSFYNQSLNIEQSSELNKLRVEFIRELDRNFQTHSNQIEYLEAPTGSGKTHLSLRYVIKCLSEGKKVIYSTQFNSVNDQTYKTFLDILKPDLNNNDENYYDLLLNNSANEIHYNENINSYDEALVKYDLLEYEFSLISNQRLLQIMFGETIKDAKAYQALKNSVIVIDELQNIDSNLWKALINNLNLLVKYFGCRVLLMSATLPNLNMLVSDSGYNLIQNRDLINHTLFKDRVQYSNELLYSSNQTEALKNKIISNFGKRQLVEFVIKKSAIQFYENLKIEYPDKEIFLITGDTKRLERLSIIHKLSEKNDEGYCLKDVILIATQVIEAGVDIDMEVGYKNISKLSSEIQFSGRINRNNLFTNSTVYLFNFNSADYQKSVFEKSNELGLVDYYNSVVNYAYKEDFDRVLNNINNFSEYQYFENYILDCQFKKAISMIKIKNISISVISNNEQSNPIILEYMKILEDRNMRFSERKIKLSKYLPKLSDFITEYPNNKHNQEFIQENGLTIIRDCVYIIGEDLLTNLKK